VGRALWDSRIAQCVEHYGIVGWWVGTLGQRDSSLGRASWDSSVGRALWDSSVGRGARLMMTRPSFKVG